jgi:hypothetical protein
MPNKMVADNPIKALDPISFILSSCSTPERNLTMAVLVIPSRNISMKAKEEMNKTHFPNSSIGKLLAKSANPVKPNNAIVKLPVSDRKLSSETIFLINFFNQSSFSTGSYIQIFISASFTPDYWKNHPEQNQ